MHAVNRRQSGNPSAQFLLSFRDRFEGVGRLQIAVEHGFGSVL
jgi:hypothetical protein